MLNKGYVCILCILALVLYADASVAGEELIARHLDICGWLVCVCVWFADASLRT